MEGREFTLLKQLGAVSYTSNANAFDDEPALLTWQGTTRPGLRRTLPMRPVYKHAWAEMIFASHGPMYDQVSEFFFFDFDR
jgi:hypothetical protein